MFWPVSEDAQSMNKCRRRISVQLTKMAHLVAETVSMYNIVHVPVCAL